MRILHLPVQKQWFDAIASGNKKIECREAKPYWIRRLEGKIFDEVHFRNGYSTSAPYMRVECLGVRKVMFQGKIHYFIDLGDILEVRNKR